MTGRTLAALGRHRYTVALLAVIVGAVLALAAAGVALL